MKPPINDAGKLRVTRRQSRNAHHPDRAGASSAAMLYDTTGPHATVTGAIAIATAGIEVTQARLYPPGAQIACVTNGFRWCAIAYGHHTMHHISSDGSAR